MDDKFADIPVDDGMILKRQRTIRIGDLVGVLQKWVLDGTRGESLVFADQDVAAFSDDELSELVMSSEYAGEDKSSTIVRNSSGFTFVNINFTF